LVFSLLPVNDMEREEGLGKNLFYKDTSSRMLLTFPVENVSTEISKGTLSSHPVSRWKNLCFSLFFNIARFIFIGASRGFLGVSVCLWLGLLFDGGAVWCGGWGLCI